MSDPLWYRSLYWRIAVGFVALLATLLVVQGFVFAWMTGQMTDVFPSRSPAQLAASIAGDVGDALVDPGIGDLSGFVNDRYSSSFRSFAVVLTDGRLAESQRVPPPPSLVRAARSRVFQSRPGSEFRGRGRRDDRNGRPVPEPRPEGPAGGPPAVGDDGGPSRPAPPDSGSGAAGDVEPDRGRDATVRGDPRARPDGRGGFGRGGFPGASPFGDVAFARIVANGDLMGIVAVPVEAPPLLVTLRALGPTLAVVALGLLVVGTAVAAVAIGRPTRRRLQQLQGAARALGSGQSGVRAPESGGDEVTALSRAFNEMAAQLDSRTRALARADRTRRQLLADVSHELMTPLAAIRGYVETLSMKDLHLQDDTRGRYLSIVSDEAVRLEHIIGDLLDLARLEGGGGVFRLEDVSIDQLLERVRHRHGPVLAERGVRLTTSRHPGLTSLRGDSNRLEQALQNLVANAIRHTPAGGIVAVEVVPRDGTVVLRVEDSGPGIAPEHLAYVFDRFYKADESRTGTETPSGSGLGLSIVQAIVQRHGGTVSASNVPDGGARFEIVLPVRRAPDPAHATGDDRDDEDRE